MQNTVKPAAPQLIIFDCDGILVDSEPIFNRVLHQYLQDQGASLSYAEIVTLFTGKNRFAVEDHMKTLGLNLPSDWSNGFYERAISILSETVEPIPWIETALEHLRTCGFALCVASNGLHAKMIATLGKTNLLRFFDDKLYSSYDVGAGKPAPDVFLHAAKIHGVSPANCVVIEDSPSGFQAAQAAGMRCFAYVPDPSNSPKPLFGAQVFTSMQDLPAHILYFSHQ